MYAIRSYYDGELHNTITPIARKRGNFFEFDLALRNNITTKEHPMGLFHPHADLHHIKKENIGLIEVMGLAILPSRLKMEMELLIKAILEGKEIVITSYSIHYTKLYEIWSIWMITSV